MEVRFPIIKKCVYTACMEYLAAEILRAEVSRIISQSQCADVYVYMGFMALITALVLCARS